MPIMLQSKSYIFSSVLYNLALADFSDKDVVLQLIDYNKTLTKSNKDLIATISILIQHGTGNMGQTTKENNK